MKLDFVHDVQVAYRKLIDSMSKPGTIAYLENEAEKMDTNAECMTSTSLLAIILLDTEVTFSIVGKNSEKPANLFNQLTYAKEVETNTADYIFILHSASAEQCEQAISDAKAGDLVHPHHSATLIIEVESINNQKDLLLRGPGIQDVNDLQVITDKLWLNVRSARNIEYPMGVDILFVDRNHRVVCIPRTTQIERRVLA